MLAIGKKVQTCDDLDCEWLIILIFLEKSFKLYQF